MEGLWSRVRSRPLGILVWKARDRARKRFDSFRSFLPFESFEFSLDAATIRRELKSRFFLDEAGIRRIAGFVAQDEALRSNLIARAERICYGEFEVLGGSKVRAEPIDWQMDYRSGLRWPAGRWAFDYDILDPGRPSDVRVVWEMNRLHDVVTLAQAYAVSCNERYAARFEELFQSWRAANPIGRSVNWSCAMDVGIRAVNLVWSLAVFAAMGGISDETVKDVCRTVVAHARFVHRNMEFNDLRNNHYLANLFALLVVARFLPEADVNGRWSRLAIRGLEREARLQIQEDGVQYEGSVPYHQLVAEMFLSALILLRRGGERLGVEAESRVERMCEFIAHYSKPSGRAPVVGDSDDGRIVPLGGQCRGDHRHLLSTAAVVFGRSDFARAAGKIWEETAWLTGQTELPLSGKPPNGPRVEGVVSRAFPYGGFFVMARGRSHVFIDCGDVGMRGRGAHGHHDVLSFEAVMNGCELFVETGCASYTADWRERRRILSASAHNAPIVDDGDIASVDEWGFPQAGPTRFKHLEWTSAPKGDRFVGEHYGFERQGASAVCRRTIELSSDGGRLSVIDEFRGEGDHKIGVGFHLHPDVSAEVKGESVSLLLGRRRRFVLRASGMRGAWSQGAVRVYFEYGRAVSAIRLEWMAALRIPGAVRFEVSEAP